MDEYVAVNAEKTHTTRADDALALVKTCSVDALSFVTAETSQLVLRAIAQVQSTTLLDITRAQLAHPLLVWRGLIVSIIVGRHQELTYRNERLYFEKGTVLLTSA